MAKKLQRKIKVQPQQVSGGGETVAKPGKSLIGRRVPLARISEFTVQLATLLDAGIPIVRALRVLEGQTAPGPLKAVINQVSVDVEGGNSLSESLEKHGKVFDSLYVNMVRAGEIGGIQDVILLRLAEFMSRVQAIRSKVKGAMAYPVVVLTLALLVIGVLLVFVIPKFIDIFAKENMELPQLTQILVGVSQFAQTWGPAIVVGIALLYGLHRLLLRKSAGYLRRRDRLFLKMPLFGPLIKKFQVARFARTFGTLIQSGVPHLEALEIVKGSLANVEVQIAVEEIHASIREGEGLARPMQNSMVFDDIVINMVDVGEETGELDRMLLKIADRYEEEVDQTISVVFKIIEPLFIVVLAVVVGLIVAALFLPMVDLMKKLGQAG